MGLSWAVRELLEARLGCQVGVVRGDRAPVAGYASGGRGRASRAHEIEGLSTIIARARVSPGERELRYTG